MSLDAVYADDIEQGLQRWAANPGPAPEPSFSVTSFLGAGGKGLPSAALESGGSIADVLSAFGTAAAASGGSAGGMFSVPTPAEQKQEAEARDRMLKGEAFDVGAGNVMRAKAQEFAPDPLTSHAADQVMHGLVRFGAKAVTDVGLLGPAGAILLGLDEGNTVTQNLRAEGIDTATATKVGAVQGAVAGASAVVPLGGKTIAQTIGLVGIGGPGSYMAQEHLSRRILENAGYNDQASLHNPFDPLGLALSTVIPAGFGAMHMRGEFQHAEGAKAGTVPLQQLRPEELRGLKYDDPRLDAFASTTAEKYGVPPALLLAIKNAGEKSGPTAVSGKGAQGVMQFMPGTAKEMGLADRTDPLASIDAGARYMRKLYDAYGSWDAAVAHYNGGGAQAAIVRGGGVPTAKETLGYLTRVREYVSQHTAQDAAKVPEAVDAARVAVLNDTVQRSLPETPDAMAQVQRAADIVGERGGRDAEQEIAPVRPLRDEVHPFESAFLHDDSNVDPEARAYTMHTVDAVREAQDLVGPQKLEEIASERVNSGRAEGDPWEPAVAAQIEMAARKVVDFYDRNPVSPELKAASDLLAAIDKGGLPLNPAKLRSIAEGLGLEVSKKAQPEETISRIRQAVDRAREQPTRDAGSSEPRRQREADNALPPHDSVSLTGDEPAKRGTEVGTQPAAGGAKAPSEPQAGGASKAAEPPSIDASLAQKLATEQPDLQVVLPGTEERITVAEAMKRIAQEQKQDGEWADLVKVAAECALSAA